MFDWQAFVDSWFFKPLQIIIVILVALVVRYILRRLIRGWVSKAIVFQGPSLLRHRRTTEPATVPEQRRAQRLRALGSLAQSTVTVVIFVFTVLTVIGMLGFNITTLVAGTSVVAVTVAFGVQSVVKDLISGIFMLVEDQLGVGDWVDMEKASGAVEEVSLRVTRLRAVDGTVWYVRNGEVLRVGNFSQGGPNRLPLPAEPT